MGVLVAGCEHHEQVILLLAFRRPRATPARAPLQGAGLGEQEAARELKLGRGDRQTVNRRHERRLAGGGERRPVEAIERALEVLGMAADLRSVEVGLFVEHVLQQRQQGGVARARRGRPPREGSAPVEIR